MEWLTLKQAGLLLGVSSSTIRSLANQDKLIVKRINKRGDRRVSKNSVLALIKRRKPEEDNLRVAIYTRVSGRGDQLTSLDNQEKELRSFLQKEPILVIKDIGSGLNENRRGLIKLLKMAKKGSIDKVIITHEDRLTRFGFNTLEQLFNSYGVEIQVLKKEEKDFHEELTEDFISLIASFSGRLYGKRSAENKKKLLREVS